MKNLIHIFANYYWKPITLMVVLEGFIKNNFIFNNPYHWLALYLVACIAFGALLIYKLFFTKIYILIMQKWETALKARAVTFRQRPMNIKTIAIIFSFGIPAVIAMWVIAYSYLYLCYKLGALFNVIIAF